MARRFDSEISVDARVIIDGSSTAVVTATGRDTLSSILNTAALTCEGEQGYDAYVVRGLSIHLQRIGVRPSYDTTLEDQALLNMRRVLMHVRQGTFCQVLCQMAKAARQLMLPCNLRSPACLSWALTEA